MVNSTNARLESEQQIADYLLTHPDFFERHLDVLAALRVPHICGSAVSLLERQLQLLRDQNQHLRQRLHELVQVARDNDCLATRMQHLNLVLIEAYGIDDLLPNIKDILRHEFNADFAALKLSLTLPHSGLSERDRLSPAALEACHDVLHRDQPWCGKPTSQQSRWLFDDAALEIASAALIPLQVAEQWRGLLAIGSRDPERFYPGAGTVFLSRIGELVSRALQVRLQRLAAASFA